jgi:hypothetical protein
VENMERLYNAAAARLGKPWDEKLEEVLTVDSNYAFPCKIAHFRT